MLKANKGAAKTTRFFVHWRGLRAATAAPEGLFLLLTAAFFGDCCVIGFPPWLKTISSLYYTFFLSKSTQHKYLWLLGFVSSDQPTIWR